MVVNVSEGFFEGGQEEGRVVGLKYEGRSESDRQLSRHSDVEPFGIAGQSKTVS